MLTKKLRLSQKIGLAVVGGWFALGGIGHFVATDFFVSIVPPWVPAPKAAVYVSGVFEIVGAIGLLHPTTRQLAGLGLILLTIMVTPANVHMWMNPEQFKYVSETMLSVRLVVQVGLLWLIWWSTQRSHHRLLTN